MHKKYLILWAMIMLFISLGAITPVLAADPDLELEKITIPRGGDTAPAPEPQAMTPVTPGSPMVTAPAAPEQPASAPIIITPSKPASEIKPPQLISLNFQNTEIGLVLKFFSEITGLTFILGDAVQGNVTVISTQRIPIDQALDMLQSILEIKGFTMIRADNAIKVVTQSEATQKNIEIRTTEGLGGDRVITQIIPLKYVLAADIRNDMQPLISRNGTMIVDDRTNSLILTDVASNIKKIMKILEYTDVQVYGDKVKVEVIPLKNTEESTIANKVTTILTNTKPRVISNLQIIPDARLHALIVITSQNNMSVVRELVTRLDMEAPKSSDNTRVFFMQNSKVTDISKILNDVLNKQGTGNVVEGGISVVTDERTNALIVTTSSQNFASVEKLLNQLDVRTPQVLIKALLVEVGLTTENKLGLEWSYTQGWGKNNPKVSGTLSQNFDLSNTIAEGIKYTVLKNDQSLSAVLQALATSTRVNILSTPQVMASNNQLASISVGEEVPILKDVSFVKSDASISGEIVKSYDYKTVAIQLQVTPRINMARDVAMDVSLIIKNILGTDAQLNAPILATREAKTNVVVKDGQTVVIGGLIKDDNSHGDSKVPLFGDIPILGWLFKKQDITRDKTELMVFITPYVVMNADEATTLTKTEESKVSLKTTPYKLSAKQYYDQGVQKYKEGNYTAAIDMFNKVVEISPNDKLAKKAADYAAKAKRKLKPTP